MSTEEIVQRTRLLDSEIKVSACNADRRTKRKKKKEFGLFWSNK